MDWLTPREYFLAAAQSPRKRFGQNFLLQTGTAERIVAAAEVSSIDTVLEVGPGLGALTRFLIEQTAKLILVELDRELASYLRDRTAPCRNKVRILQNDILEVNLEELSEEAGSPLVILGNLPYNISSPLLFQLLESRSSVARAVFMLQREVGERLVALPGGKQYGVLSVLLQAFADPRLLFRVGPKQFFPAPQVDSVVIHIDFQKPLPERMPPFGVMRRLVSAAFAKRRKTLRNNLQGSVTKPAELERIMQTTGIAPQRRAETLSPTEFVALARSLEGGA